MKDLMQKVFNNPYTTIFQYLELKLDSQTVIDSITELQKLSEPSDNQELKKRIKDVEDYVRENFPADILADTARPVQGSILLALKIKLY